MTLQELIDQSAEKLKTFNVRSFLPALRKCNQGALDDVLNTNGCAYYQWTPGLLEVLKPKQIVELGGAMGVWDLMVLNGAYQDFDLYSITLPEGGLEYSFIADTYSNFHPVLGDDLNLENWDLLNKVEIEGEWGMGVDLFDLSQTDIWFFDALHTQEHLTKELELYKQFFKPGALILIDDIRMDELWPVWQSLPYEKVEVTNPLHYSGFGIAKV